MQAPSPRESDVRPSTDEPGSAPNSRAHEASILPPVATPRVATSETALQASDTFEVYASRVADALLAAERDQQPEPGQIAAELLRNLKKNALWLAVQRHLALTDGRIVAGSHTITGAGLSAPASGQLSLEDVAKVEKALDRYVTELTGMGSTSCASERLCGVEAECLLAAEQKSQKPLQLRLQQAARKEALQDAKLNLSRARAQLIALLRSPEVEALQQLSGVVVDKRNLIRRQSSSESILVGDWVLTQFGLQTLKKSALTGRESLTPLNLDRLDVVDILDITISIHRAQQLIMDAATEFSPLDGFRWVNFPNYADTVVFKVARGQHDLLYLSSAELEKIYSLAGANTKSNVDTAKWFAAGWLLVERRPLLRPLFEASIEAPELSAETFKAATERRAGSSLFQPTEQLRLKHTEKVLSVIGADTRAEYSPARHIDVQTSPDGRFVSILRSSSADVWDARNGKRHHFADSYHPIRFDPLGEYFLVPYRNRCEVWNIPKGDEAPSRAWSFATKDYTMAGFDDDGSIVTCRNNSFRRMRRRTQAG